MKKRYISLVAILFPIAMAILCLWLVIVTNNQSMMCVPLPIDFVGEYSYDGEKWYPYNENCDISALDGDVV